MEKKVLRKKQKMFTLRLTTSDFEIIQRKAKKANLNLTDYITLSALNKEIKRIDGLEPVTSELKAIGRNLNQAVTLANMGKIKILDLDSVTRGLAKIYKSITVLTESEVN